MHPAGGEVRRQKSAPNGFGDKSVRRRWEDGSLEMGDGGEAGGATPVA